VKNVYPASPNVVFSKAYGENKTIMCNQIIVLYGLQS